MSNEQFFKQQELIISDLHRKLMGAKRNIKLILIISMVGYFLIGLNQISHIIN
jgi:hypothetical protein